MKGADLPVTPAEVFHSPETEQAVLACLMLDPRLMEEVLLHVEEGSFGSKPAARIFRAMAHLHDAGEPIDLRTLQRTLESWGQLANVGGVAALATLDQYLPDLGRCEVYCRAVARDAVRRQVARLARLALDRLGTVDDPGDVRDELAQAAQLLDEATAVDHGAVTLGEMLEVAAARYEGLRSGSRAVGLQTGFPRIDAAIVGIAAREFWVIAGYAGSGKTTLVEQLVYEWAARGERPLLVSLEMGREQTEDRAVARGVGAPLVFVRRGTFDHSRLAGWSEKVRSSGAADRLRAIFPRTNRLADLVAAVRAIHRRHPMTVVVIDHLHRIQVPGLDRRYEVDLIARELKQLAIELEIPIVAPAQISRASVRDGRRPRLWDLAESAAIEREIDGALMIHRPDQGPAELYVEKARQGEAGPGASAALYFDERSRTLREETSRYDPPPPRRPAPARPAATAEDPNLRALEEAL